MLPLKVVNTVAINIVYLFFSMSMIFTRQTRCVVVYVTIGNTALCLALYLTGVHFRGKLQHVGHVGEQKMKCRPART